MANERLTWRQIQERYPDQWVGITDVEYEPDNDSTIRYATVVDTSNDKDELTELQLDTNGKILARYTAPDNIFQLGTVGYFV